MKLKNKIGAGLAALLVAGGIGVAAAPAASAHTGDLNVSYTCDTTTGEYVGTAELTISQTGLAGVTNWKVGTTNFEGTPSSDAGLSGALPSTGAGKITLGQFRIPGDTKTKGPWVYAFTTWTDGFKKGSDGQSYQNLGGDCKVPPPPVLKDAAASIVTTPATCEANGSARWDVLTNATGSELVQTVGAQTGVATAAANHQFPDGSASLNVPYTIEPKLDPGKAPCYTPPPPPTNTCPGVISGDTSTNLNDLWTNIDTRATGHQEYVEGGLRVWTEGSTSTDKVSEGRAVSFPLKNTGVVSLDYTATIGNVKPGVNLFVNFGTDGNGTLVFEPTYADGSLLYGQDAWLTNGSSAAVKANAPVNGGGNGSQWHGTIDQWLTKYPDAQVTGIAYSAGSGVYLDGVIHSINVGCTTFYFDYEKPPVVVPEQPEPIVTVVETEEVDCDTKTVTTTVTTTTSNRTVYNEETNTWDPIEDLVEVTSSERAATAEECPATVTPTPTPTASTPAPQPSETPDGVLAFTGAPTMAPFLWFAGSVIGLGLIALIVTAIIQRRKARATEQ